ncbi:MAG: hypothetical protein PHX18_07575 [Candidatus Gastranaerophilales bacterium]|nr:hypothetical protein [Candidatus Gastranaerophilales bacterium]
MNNKIEELALLSERIYNLSSVLKEYCKANNNDLDEILNLYSLVEYLHDNIDKLNDLFIDMEY